MPLADSIHAWLASNAPAPAEIDCTVALMLKIIDGKCRMSASDKAAAALLYDALADRNGALLDPALHALIARSRNSADEALRLAVYEQRVLAETMISRPVMKAWKARLREAGILGRAEDPEENP